MTYGLFINFHVTYRNYTDDSVQIESVFMTLNNTNTGVVYGYELLVMSDHNSPSANRFL